MSTNGAVRTAAELLVLLRVMVSAETAFGLTVSGAKALPSETVEGEVTVRVAMAGSVLFLLLVCRAPAASELT